METQDSDFKKKYDLFFGIDPVSGQLGAKIVVDGKTGIVPWDNETIMRPELVQTLLFDLGCGEDGSPAGLEARQATEKYCLDSIAEIRYAGEDNEGPALLDLGRLATGFYAGYLAALNRWNNIP